MSAIVYPLRRLPLEKPGLPECRTYACSLEEQLFEHAGAPARIGRQQLPGLLGEINQDRPRLGQREGFSTWSLGIDQHGNLAVRIQRQEVRQFLLPFADEEHFDKTFDTNVRGLFFSVQKALPLLSPGASVILNGSIASIKGASCE